MGFVEEQIILWPSAIQSTKWLIALGFLGYLCYQALLKFVEKQKIIDLVDKVPGPRCSRFNPIGNLGVFSGSDILDPVLSK